MDSVRVRFAPSPTGYLHVGGLRTALYNYLFAKHYNGTFILRIEDTDQSRKVEGATENLIDSLNWGGVVLDEGPGKEGRHGPYLQSQRLEIYHSHIKKLISDGNAYFCFCDAERLEQMRKQQSEAGLDPKYDRHCRTISATTAQQRVDAGESHVVRMRIPLESDIIFKDEIRDVVKFAYSTLDDQVILKSDGFPTYHLAVVVDDHLMGISHVIRGEEWLPSTPKHILLYKFFGWEIPKFAHLPLLLNADKSKLSKRQGDVAVEEYRAKGYLKEALVNFVALLGWNPGNDREIFSMDDLIKEFSLDRVGKAGAVFNIEKLNWMNQQHIKLKNADELLSEVRPIADSHGLTDVSDEYLKQVIDLMKERVVLLPDFVDNCPYFFSDPKSYDEISLAKSWKSESNSSIRKLLEKLELLDRFDSSSIEQSLRTTAEELKVGAGKLIHPTRLAVSGVSQGPSLFHMMEVLGKETTIRRIKTALSRLP